MDLFQDPIPHLCAKFGLMGDMDLSKTREGCLEILGVARASSQYAALAVFTMYETYALSLSFSKLSRTFVNEHAVA